MLSLACICYFAAKALQADGLDPVAVTMNEVLSTCAAGMLYKVGSGPPSAWVLQQCGGGVRWH